MSFRVSSLGKGMTEDQPDITCQAVNRKVNYVILRSTVDMSWIEIL